MVSIDERRLRARLARVEALERGATTDGERTAAAAARARLTARITGMRLADPVARFVAAQVAALGVGAAPPEPPAFVPAEAQVLRVLRRWSSGDWSRQDVEDWAESVVDRVVLPTDPDHADACISEVLLQLAMLHRVALDVTDVPAIRRFMQDRNWRAWFATVEAASRRRRPVG